MLTNPTLEQMQRLGLHGMVAAYRDLAEQANELDHEDWLALMLDREETVRADKRLANRLRAAKLRFPEACIEDIDFASGRGLDRRTVLSFAEGAWLKAHENIIVSGRNRNRQDVVGLRPRSPSCEARPLRALCPYIKAVRGPRQGPPRQQPAAARRQTHPRPAPDPR